METLARRRIWRAIASCIGLLGLLSLAAVGQEGGEIHGHGAAVAHTHVGVNPTWRPADWANPAKGETDLDPTDDNKLWLFSMPPTHEAATPGWPNWLQADGSAFLVLAPLLEEGLPIVKPGDPNKALYTCHFTYSNAEGYGDPHGAEHLDGVSSAFGPQCAWNLQSRDPGIVPAWDIYLRRERVSSNLEEEDFLMLLPDDTPVLQRNGDTYLLGKSWLADQGAWGIHDHLGFYFWLDAGDTEVCVVLSAHDAGGMYQRSADFVIRFARRVRRPVPGDVNGDGIVGVQDLRIVVDNLGRSGFYSVEPAPHDHEDEP